MNLRKIFKGKTILITGGTGSFGQALTSNLLRKEFGLKKIIIFSRDELKQYEMKNKFNKFNSLRFLLGDVRDLNRLQLAFRDCDIVIHAAALKQVPAAEYNPFEFIKTNILGAQNIIEASLNSPVKKIIALSTDKACSPLNLYGATKLAAEKLFIAAQNIVGNQKLNFSVVRYGNVFGSRGSVLPVFIEKSKKNEFPITDEKMTRFMMTLQESVNFVINSTIMMRGGEIFIPKLPSFKITDVALALNSKAKFKIIGIRPGEKIHEELINVYESRETFELKNFYIIRSSNYENTKMLYKNNEFKMIKKNFSYNSLNNNQYLSIKNIKSIILSNYKNIKL
jgi:UDP-N-acetylglucosamine 4,6-dehydratase (inverting)